MTFFQDATSARSSRRLREYLVQNKYAAPGKVAINGASNGGTFSEPSCIDGVVTIVLAGLLVAACVNRAPEGLLGAAVAEVGVLDLLKVG